MTLNFPPPSNWQDFQSLTFRLAEQMCAPLTVREYGRQGQFQSGVDIYGEMPAGLHLGVQCKEMKQGNKLTKALIEAEADSARNFQPQLTTFVIATTLSEDTAMHQAVSELNQSGKYPFKITYWSWNYFNDRLNRSNQLVQDCYKDYAKSFGYNELEIDLKALQEGFNRNAFTDDFANELCCTSYLEALSDTLLFLQTGMLRDRLSQDLIGATYSLNMLPRGANKSLRIQLQKEVKKLRDQALNDNKNGQLDRSKAVEYNASRGAVIAMLNRDLAAHNLPLIYPSYRI